jgi:hypothetical protein
MKWLFLALLLLLLPLSAAAQLPFPITPDWLENDRESGVLHSTHVTLTGSNYRIVQTNITARSRGFKLLGFITIKSPSYVQAMSRLYAQAHVEEGAPQALANVVYETGGLNLILFSLPKIRIRADLIEFADYAEDDAGPVPVRQRVRERSTAPPRER